MNNFRVGSPVECGFGGEEELHDGESVEYSNWAC